ncbi:MAG: hypothetical protein JWM12_2760, partial [Ilumatobacteraceae bacterium]|nr:hypothetical protein [Ilumatobacteraceae bacterium]
MRELARSLLRRPGRAGWIAIAGLALFAFVGIGGPLVGRGAFSAAEQLKYSSPWVYDLNVQRTDGQSPLSDTYKHYEPAAHEASSRLRHGDLAWTSPYEHGGTMLVGWLGDGLADLMNLPWLILPTTFAPGYVKLLEIIVASGFTYLFCRRVGVGRAAAWVGGLAYAASGFQIAWTNWPQSRVGALSPGLLWAVERLVQRRRPSDVALLAALVAWHFGAGFPSVTVMTLILVGAYAAFRLVQTSGRDVRRLLLGAGAAGAGVALGIGVMAMQLIGLDHVLSASDISNRAVFLGRHSDLHELATALLPGGLGLPELGGQTAFGNIVEIQTFVGGAVALMVLGLLVRRRTSTELPGVAAFFAIAAAASVFLLFVGGPPLELLQRAVPKLAENYFGRWRSVLGLCVAVLAAFGADRWALPDTRRQGPRRWRWWSAAAAAVVATAGFTYAALTPVAPANVRSFDRSLVVLLGACAATVGALLLLRHRPSLGIGLVAPIIALEALAFVLPYWHRSPDDLFYPGASLLSDARRLEGPDRIEAIAAVGQGASTWYQLRTATGYSPVPRPWADLLITINPSLAPTTWGTQIASAEQALAEPALLDRLAVRYLLLGQPFVPNPIPAEWRVIETSPGGVLVERPTALARIRWATGSIVVAPSAQTEALAAGVDPEIVVLDAPSGAAEGGAGSVGTIESIDERDSDDRTYRVHADGAGYLVVADAYDRWWDVTVDGEHVPLLRADHAM